MSHSVQHWMRSAPSPPEVQNQSFHGVSCGSGLMSGARGTRWGQSAWSSAKPRGPRPVSAVHMNGYIYSQKRNGTFSDNLTRLSSMLKTQDSNDAASVVVTSLTNQGEWHLHLQWSIASAGRRGRSSTGIDDGHTFISAPTAASIVVDHCPCPVLGAATVVIDR